MYKIPLLALSRLSKRVENKRDPALYELAQMAGKTSCCELAGKN